jgi:ATP-dependent helicase YprA (DUF1998 family)
VQSTVTSQEKRELISNLYASMLVLDEAHMYRGIFGSHVSCILRRLFRLAQAYDGNPQLIACTATIANPREHFHLLVPFLQRRLEIITRDGSPRGKKLFCIWNPYSITKPKEPKEPEKDMKKDGREGKEEIFKSTIYQAALLLTQLVQQEAHSIMFCKV